MSVRRLKGKPMSNINYIHEQIQQIDSRKSFESFFSKIKDIFGYSAVGIAVFEYIDLQSYLVKDYGIVSDELVERFNHETQFIKYCFNETAPKLSNDVSRSRYRFDSKANTTFMIPTGCYRNKAACLIIELRPELCDQETLQMIGKYWKIFAGQLFEYYRKYVDKTDFTITQREKQCIQWASMGKTAWEISQILEISQKTVEFHLANCVKKTNSTNRQHAIVKCILSGQF